MKPRMKGWHFDSQDTEYHRRILRTSEAAQRTRIRFPAGTIVRLSDAYPQDGRTAKVLRHVPGTNAQGGDLTLLWDNGQIQQGAGPINFTPVTPASKDQETTS